MMAADNLLNTVRAFYEDFSVVELCVRFKTCSSVKQMYLTKCALIAIIVLIIDARSWYVFMKRV